MGTAPLKQKFQDWVTQQWVISFGKKISQAQYRWLLGPFGDTKGIGTGFINELTQKEQLIIDRNQTSKGLLQSIHQLNLSQDELKVLSKNVIDFYENTADYNFNLKAKWNPIFKGLGILLNVLFSNRIEQLNIPTENIKDSKELTSEIIYLVDAKTKKVKRTIWLRTFKPTGKVVYSGVYETCSIPSGQTCIKAVFPLPNGNATVVLNPSVGKNGELILKSSGKKMGDSGFYFLLKDSKENLWVKFIQSFEDTLVVGVVDNHIIAEQTLTLWGLTVLKFEYSITKKEV